MCHAAGHNGDERRAQGRDPRRIARHRRRHSASGLQAIAVAARSVVLDGVKIAVAGGIESISLVQNEHMNKFHAVDDGLMAMKPAMYISMLETAEVVAERYKISRERQDKYASSASAAPHPPFRAAVSATSSFRSRPR
jgi:acetyl-CoA acetyltransferase